MMELEDIKNLRVVQTKREKLFNIFTRRYLSIVDSSGDDWQNKVQLVWHKYLDSFEGIKHIRKVNNRGDSFDYFLDLLGEVPFLAYVINDPDDRDSLIVIDKEFAEKALVLGSLP